MWFAVLCSLLCCYRPLRLSCVPSLLTMLAYEACPPGFRNIALFLFAFNFIISLCLGQNKREFASSIASICLLDCLDLIGDIGSAASL